MSRLYFFTAQDLSFFLVACRAQTSIRPLNNSQHAKEKVLYTECWRGPKKIKKSFDGEWFAILSVERNEHCLPNGLLRWKYQWLCSFQKPYRWEQILRRTLWVKWRSICLWKLSANVVKQGQLPLYLYANLSSKLKSNTWNFLKFSIHV